MKKPKIVKDCIYRFIEVPPLCLAFMDVPEFQRLRGLKQLGFVSFVFPSACHTRFEHSLGVMHLAGVMCDQLGIQGRTKDLVQLAGLYHDTGHGPFSHFAEKIIRPIKTHEEIGIEKLKSANDRLQLLMDEEIQMVTKMILGGDTYLYQIIHHPKGFDVDRFDYLDRDSHYTGMHSYQSDYIIKSAYVDEKTQQLTFLSKAQAEIQQMLDTRQRMFQTVYHHKTVAKVEYCVEKMVRDNKLQLTMDMDDSDVMHLLKQCPEYQAIFLNRKFI